mmetsp:Transcript_116214/g.339949  ORF Transcript_116214/g.339949 Transcript_116214/m.339949 type:complete len:429 (-) Transcript_116214:476-1762(-)
MSASCGPSTCSSRRWYSPSDAPSSAIVRNSLSSRSGRQCPAAAGGGSSSRRSARRDSSRWCPTRLPGLRCACSSSCAKSDPGALRQPQAGQRQQALPAPALPPGPRSSSRSSAARLRSASRSRCSESNWAERSVGSAVVLAQSRSERCWRSSALETKCCRQPWHRQLSSSRAGAAAGVPAGESSTAPAPWGAGGVEGSEDSSELSSEAGEAVPQPLRLPPWREPLSATTGSWQEALSQGSRDLLLDSFAKAGASDCLTRHCGKLDWMNARTKPWAASPHSGCSNSALCTRGRCTSSANGSRRRRRRSSARMALCSRPAAPPAKSKSSSSEASSSTAPSPRGVPKAISAGASKPHWASSSLTSSPSPPGLPNKVPRAARSSAARGAGAGLLRLFGPRGQLRSNASRSSSCRATRSWRLTPASGTRPPPS